MLLLSGTPPGSGNVGGIILRDFVLHYGPQLVQCAIVAPHYPLLPDVQLAQMDLQQYRPRHLFARRHGTGLIAAVLSDLRVPFELRSEASALVSTIVHAARASRVEVVFVVLDNALMMTIAHRVAERLGLPMVALVWDPPDYALRQFGFARFSRRWLLREFERTLARCRRVAVVSDSMREAYKCFTSAPIQLLRHGRTIQSALPAATKADLEEEFWTIGFAGSMYADCAWSALQRALDGVRWRVAGRRVRLRIMTAKAVLESRSQACIEFLGFRADEEVDMRLAACDLSYLPQPFKPHLKDLSRYAFPTKLAAYLRAGKPVFVHCPENSALGDYFAEQPFGAICRSLDPGAIIAALEALLIDADVYQAACAKATELAQTQFDISIFHAAIDELFDAQRVPPADHAASAFDYSKKRAV